MKFIHTGDIHIGKVVNEFSMLEDQKYIIQQILQIIEEEQADGFIIAGDIYDRTIPPAEAVAVLDLFLTELSRRKVPVLMVSGNHDSPERIGFAGEMLQNSGIHISGTFSLPIEQVVMEDSYGKVRISLIPFAKPAVMRHFLNQQQIEVENTYDNCMKAVVKQLNLNQQERNILVSHHFVTNCGVSPQLSDSETRVTVGGTENVEADTFADFDYVALGHIHKAQKVGAEHIRYAGSPLKYSFSEVHHKKTVTVVTLKEKGSIKIEERELKPLHDMRKIKGKLKDLTSDDVVKVGNPQDYIHGIITDEEELMDPIGSMRAVYPNIMQLSFEKNQKKEEKELASSGIKSRSTLELYKEFYEGVTERDFDEKRQSIIIKAIEETEGGYKV